MMHFSLEIDASEVEKKLQGTNITVRRAGKAMMNAVNKKVVQKARKDFCAAYDTKHMNNEPYANEYFRPRTKPVEKSYRYGNSKREDFASFVSNRTFYSRFLESGAYIRPKKPDGWLMFKINGEFRRVRSVRLMAKPILGDAVRTIWDSPEAERLMDEALQKQLEKYWQKAGK